MMNRPRHGGGHAHDNDKRDHQNTGLRLHKDWRAWLVVVLMLAAMVVYVMTMDESLQPSPLPADHPATESGTP